MKLDCKFCWNNYLLYNDLYIIKIIMYVPYICFRLIQSHIASRFEISQFVLSHCITFLNITISRYIAWQWNISLYHQYYITVCIHNIALQFEISQFYCASPIEILWCNILVQNVVFKNVMIYKVKIGIFQTLMQYLWYNLWYFKLWYHYIASQFLPYIASHSKTNSTLFEELFASIGDLTVEIWLYKMKFYLFYSSLKYLLMATTKLWCNSYNTNWYFKLWCNIHDTNWYFKLWYNIYDTNCDAI
jgi:hypothetical protein